VVVSGVGGSGYNGTFTVASTPTSTTFTYANTGGNESSAADTGGTVAFPNVDYPVIITGFIDSENASVETTNGSTLPDISGANLIVSINTNANRQNDEIDLTHYSKFKSIDSIVTMRSKPTAKGDKPVSCIGPPKITPKTFEGQKYSPNYAKVIIWYKRGEIIECAKGVLPSYGQRELHVKLNPEPVLVETDLLDVRNNDVPQIKKLVEIKVINALQKNNVKVPIPQELLNWYSKLKESKASEDEKKLDNRR
jgi:hypothetical protein